MSDFVTILTYDEYLSANFDKQKLEENEILCYLADEYTITCKWTWKNAMGGIKLRVRDDDAAKAIEILDEEQEATPIDFQIETNAKTLICPNCNSNNTATDRYSYLSLGLTWVVLGFPINLNINKQSRCFYCGVKWVNS